MANRVESIRQQSVGIIGAGPAGLITGYTLLHDGFQNVQLLTRDKSAGGVWAKQRMYPGISVNSVHGEFRFSPLTMSPRMDREKSGNRLSGEDIAVYMEEFANNFLTGKIRFETEVLDVRRGQSGIGWDVEVLDLTNGDRKVLSYARIVLCTGGFSQANIPTKLLTRSAKQAGFRGLVVHSSEVASCLDEIVTKAKTNSAYSVVVIGGGKSAKDVSTHLVRHGVGVTVVFEKTDAVLACPIRLPDWIRKSRLVGIFSPHIELRSQLERFLHTTTLGSIITHAFWNFLTQSSINVLQISKDSPLRNAYSLFWSTRNNDEGTWRKDGFHSLVRQGKIKLVAPNRAVGYSSDGESVVLQDGKTLRADAVILATGFSSSWTGIFTEKTIEELGIGIHHPLRHVDEWRHYKSLAAPPATHPQRDQWSLSIYRGIVPAKSIAKLDFAINGAVSSGNNGYGYEVIAHWISSYFLEDKMRLPTTVEDALAQTERESAWLSKRYPQTLSWANGSYSSALPLFTWPQATDKLLEDMGLRSMRSGGNWLTWPFKAISVDEIATLGEERRAKREVDSKVNGLR